MYTERGRREGGRDDRERDNRMRGRERKRKNIFLKARFGF